MPGIVQIVSIYPIGQLVLHTKLHMLLMGEITKTVEKVRVNVVFTINITGNLSDILRNTEKEGK